MKGIPSGQLYIYCACGVGRGGGRNGIVGIGKRRGFWCIIGFGPNRQRPCLDGDLDF